MKVLNATLDHFTDEIPVERLKAEAERGSGRAGDCLRCLRQLVTDAQAGSIMCSACRTEIAELAGIGGCSVARFPLSARALGIGLMDGRCNPDAPVVMALPFCHACVAEVRGDLSVLARRAFVALGVPDDKMAPCMAYADSPDDIRPEHSATTTMLNVTIGARWDLSRSGLRNNVKQTAAILRKIGPLPPAMISMLGYDDDPRELWEIPAAREYLVRWADRLERTEGITLDRFIAHDRELYKACKAGIAGMDVQACGTPETYVRDIVDYQRKVN